ncbi:MAG TPA: hypothetical protein VII78_19740 [Myxococcota bacterium]|jgi:hypothetical protein
MSRFTRPFAALTLAGALAAIAAPGAASAESRFSGTLQLDVTNAYIFRGIMNEKKGFIAQPWGEAYFNIYSSEDGFIRDITAGVGFWLSIHSEETLATNGPQSIYEADYYPLVSIDLAGGFNLLTTYYFYDSPNGAWDEAVQELNFKLSYDDEESLGLAPWINIAVETFSTSLGSNSGTGIQVGVAPTFYENDHFSVDGSAELGFSVGDYYEGVGPDEDTFGYANLGIGLGIPISDTFSATVGFKYFLFGNDLQVVNGGHGSHGVGTVSLNASF